MFPSSIEESPIFGTPPPDMSSTHGQDISTFHPDEVDGTEVAPSLTVNMVANTSLGHLSSSNITQVSASGVKNPPSLIQVNSTPIFPIRSPAKQPTNVVTQTQITKPPSSAWSTVKPTVSPTTAALSTLRTDAKILIKARKEDGRRKRSVTVKLKNMDAAKQELAGKVARNILRHFENSNVIFN